MNQGKLDVVKQETARMNINILGIGELKWTGMKVKESDEGLPWFSLWVRKIAWKRNGYPLIPVFFSKEFHGHRTLAGYRMGEFNSDDHDIYYCG